MVSNELLAYTADRVDQWVNTTRNDILTAMQKVHENIVIEQIIDYSGISRDLEIWRRAYSEMALSGAWNLLEPPEGFEIIPWEIGRVNIIGPSTKLAMLTYNHIYAQSSDDLILCITPGQFEAVARTDLCRGDRLRLLKNQAPTLMSLHFDNQGRLDIGTLVGTREEIAQKLNFDYTIVEPEGFEPSTSSM